MSSNEIDPIPRRRASVRLRSRAVKEASPLTSNAVETLGPGAELLRETPSASEEKIMKFLSGLDAEELVFLTSILKNYWQTMQLVPHEKGKDDEGKGVLEEVAEAYRRIPPKIRDRIDDLGAALIGIMTKKITDMEKVSGGEGSGQKE